MECNLDRNHALRDFNIERAPLITFSVKVDLKEFFRF